MPTRTTLTIRATATTLTLVELLCPIVGCGGATPPAPDPTAAEPAAAAEPTAALAPTPTAEPTHTPTTESEQEPTQSIEITEAPAIAEASEPNTFAGELPVFASVTAQEQECFNARTGRYDIDLTVLTLAQARSDATLGNMIKYARCLSAGNREAMFMGGVVAAAATPEEREVTGCVFDGLEPIYLSVNGEPESLTAAVLAVVEITVSVPAYCALLHLEKADAMNRLSAVGDEQREEARQTAAAREAAQRRQVGQTAPDRRYAT